VDYGRQMALKRAVLEKLAHAFHVGGGALHPEFEAFVERHPRLQDYAAFRATIERRDTTWHEWPGRLRAGTLKKGDYDERNKRYHVYVQWLAENQAAEIAESSTGLYLDLPLGVHPDGYDVWKERDTFLEGCAAGAPPDPVFTRGQNWGLTPLHPERARATGYGYLADCLRHQLHLAGALRIDHVMSFHRLFCIPEGMSAEDGVYVTYRPEELWAVATLESRRHQSMLVGEDLGSCWEPAFALCQTKGDVVGRQRESQVEGELRIGCATGNEQAGAAEHGAAIAAQNIAFDPPEILCWQCPLAAEGRPARVGVTDNLFYRNRWVHPCPSSMDTDARTFGDRLMTDYSSVPLKWYGGYSEFIQLYYVHLPAR
jgi:hypothetical protein